MNEIVRSWGRILAGYKPALSIELTRECPLRCPGCYAQAEAHAGPTDMGSQKNPDFRGQELVDRVLAAIQKHKPVHVSLIGGEPLVRYRDLSDLLPRMSALGVHTMLVTSAVRPIPPEWARIPRLQISVSVDGLAPEHDVRRSPATYERVLKNIEGHNITVHCTVTRQQAVQRDYLEKFVQFWSDRRTTRRIWISIYTPQTGEQSSERLSREDRQKIIAELLLLRAKYKKLEMPESLIRAYARPPASPAECAFSLLTTSLSTDLEHEITPCQLGGNPDCSECGCMATAGFTSIVRHKLPVGLRIQPILQASFKVGSCVRFLRSVYSPSGNGHYPKTKCVAPMEFSPTAGMPERPQVKRP